MTELYGTPAILAGIVLRLAIPVLITAIIVHFLRKLDERWQSEAKRAPAQVEKPACWEIMQCTPEQRRDCPAFTSPLPCWQVRRLANGYLREECLECKVFQTSPAPGVA